MTCPWFENVYLQAVEADVPDPDHPRTCAECAARAREVEALAARMSALAGSGPATASMAQEIAERVLSRSESEAARAPRTATAWAAAALLIALGLPMVFHLVPAAIEPAADVGRKTVRDAEPAYVAWDKGWTVHRYDSKKDEWESTGSPEAPLDHAVTAVGAESVAVLLPTKRYSGWLFEFKTRRWTELPAIPEPEGGDFSPPGPLAVGFVGNRLVAWGGTAGRPDARGPARGFLLNRAALEWTPLPAAPIDGRNRCAMIGVGSKLVVWGGYYTMGESDEASDGAVLDLSADTWTKLPEAPVKFGYGTVWTAWRDRLVVFGGGGSRSGAVYNVAAGTWEKIAEAPFEIGAMSACAAESDRLVLWSGYEGAAERGAAYDLRTREWKELPKAPIRARCLGLARGIGGRVVVWGGWDPNTEKFVRSGAEFDLEKWTWKKIQDAPAAAPSELHPGW